jgi:hypothetical protein
MFLKLFFERLTVERQANFMRRRGIVVGTRKKKDGREGYLYMVNNLFAEIFYEGDNPKLKVESLVVLDGIRELNSRLERDGRARG